MNRQAMVSFLVALAAGPCGRCMPSDGIAGPGRETVFSSAAPGATFSIRTGYDIPRAGSDIFSYTSELLTLDKSNFAAPAISEWIVGVRLSDRLDLVAGVGYAKSETPSEFRDWEDTRRPAHRAGHHALEASRSR